MKPSELTPTEMARAIALGWGGDDDRDAGAARAARKLVKERASVSLLAKLAAHGLDRASRISTATRLERVSRDLAADPSVDGDALFEAFIDAGSTGVALALSVPARATALLRSRVHDHELGLTQLGLTSLPAEVGALGKSIRTIDLQYNNITTLPHELAKLPELRTLHLAYNEMRNVPLAVLELSKLTALSLNDNALTALPDAIGDLAELRDLWLGDNPLEDLPLGMLRLRKLRFLHLGSIPWKEPPAMIAQMTSLEELWIASPALERLPVAICRLPKLRRLHLWYSKLTSVPEELFACTKLTELRISHNPLPEETFERLRKALPRCTIY